MPFKIDFISENKQEYIGNVLPNVVLNRYDMLYGNDWQMIRVMDDGGNNLYIPMHQHGRAVSLGIYMRDIESDMPGVLNAVCGVVFNNFKVDVINITHTKTPFRGAANTVHCHIELPNTIDEFDAKLSHRVRYNTKWYPKKIRENVGEIGFEIIDAKNCPDEIVDLYFQWKQETHNRKYHLSAAQYLKKFAPNRVYVMRAGGKTLAIGFTVETGDNVYFENFSYDTAYKKYSPGMVLYYHIICDLITRHKRMFYLLSEYEYKVNYNGIRTQTYTGSVFRSETKIAHLKKLAVAIKRLPKFLLKIFVLVYGNIFLSRPYKHFLKDEVNRK